MEMLNFAIDQHEILVGLGGLLFVFILSRFSGAYIEEWVRFKYRQHADGDCTCPAMDMVREDIPEIRRIQTERTKTVSEIQQTLCTLVTSFERQEKNIDKLFNLFEEEWKSTIKELKGKA